MPQVSGNYSHKRKKWPCNVIAWSKKYWISYSLEYESLESLESRITPRHFRRWGGLSAHTRKKKNLIFSGRVEYQKDPENFWLTCPCFQNDISHIKTNFIDFLNADIQIALLGWSIPTNSYLLMHSFWVQIYWLKSTFGKQKSI